ncbi:BLOC-1 related complex subunit 6 isoform X2 [Lycorma delicatula]|uniref:BLOC-1 related complex subunit 6 isoform X2 n=1 Tax=Lycorma delicatula TaxID=130591 RepID=UPI003F51011D
MAAPDQINQNLTDSDSDGNDSVTCSSAHPNTSAKRRGDVTSTIDFDDEIIHGMTASYTEISFNTQSSEPDDSILEDNNISGCLQELELATGHNEIKSDCEEQVSAEHPIKCEEQLHERPSRLSLFNDQDNLTGESDDNLPKHKAVGYLNQLNGTVIQEGELVLFVAEDLENKIKLSSPVGKKDDALPPFGSVSSWSNSTWLYRQSLMNQFPVIDASILNDLEDEVGRIATSVDSLTENLAEILHSSMYQLMAKCEELSKSMKPIYKLSQHIKEIKHFLDLFENSTN